MLSLTRQSPPPFGLIKSYDLVTTVWKARGQIPTWLAAVYLIGNPVLNLLNVFWCAELSVLVPIDTLTSESA